MLFSGPTFLYWFLPATLALYFLVPSPKGSPRLKNILLLAVSMLFYAWGEPKYVFLMAAQCLFAWAFGILIDRASGKRSARAFAALSVLVSFSGLVYFKYANFFISNVNAALNASLPLVRLAMPIGVSFYTFQIVSYTLDLYWGKTDVQKSPVEFSCYVALFPQLIAGPIVRYADVAKELLRREHTVEGFAYGARRFAVGLAKKMLLANAFGELVGVYKGGGDRSALFVWIYLLAYSMQIYFDFSGYSDMAIGLGRIFGFKFLENFNYPYVAESITDFWRRWHMSLSGWFRDYVYIPLGGNRVPLVRQIFNILAVWALTGFWHGADWNFILWGAFFGVALLAEKFAYGKALARLPRALRHAYVLLIVFVSWAFFDSVGIFEPLGVIGRMFGIGDGGFLSDSLVSVSSTGSILSRVAGAEALYYLKSYALLMIIGIIGCTPAPKLAAKALFEKRGRLAAAFEPVAVAAALALSTASMVDGSFNPFIYFRF